MNEISDKKELRSVYLNKRADINDRHLKDSSISMRILNSEKIKNADVILLYASFGSEISSYIIIEKLLNQNKTVALPKCRANGVMSFHIITSLTELTKGKYNIPEPNENLPSPSITDKTVCIVPALSFTLNGERLGYGGGYYDRFLADNPNVFSIGLTYETLIAPKLPVLSHDLKVNEIVTEERTVLCGA